jgi:hypothetical protein
MKQGTEMTWRLAACFCFLSHSVSFLTYGVLRTANCQF